MGRETCEQCRRRQERICELQRSDCYAGRLFVTAGGVVGCAAFTAGLAMPICGFIVGLFGGIYVGACSDLYQACLLGIPDKCPQC